MEFDEWLDQHLSWLLRLATVLTGDRHLAEDLAQDVVLKAHARWDTIATLDHPQAYVRKMAVNQHLSWRRRRQSAPTFELTDRATDTPLLADQHADRAELLAELARLPRKQRAVVVLRFFEGLDDAAIAATLGCGQSTVRSHAARALATLRVTLTASRKEDSRAY